MATADRHISVLTLTTSSDPVENYTVTVTERGNFGNVSPQSTSSALAWTIRGGRIGSSVPGPVTLDVLARGNTSAAAAAATISLTLRALGDVNGDGAVDASDLAVLDQRLNGLYGGALAQRAFDLTGDGYVTAADRVVLNMVINGVTVP